MAKAKDPYDPCQKRCLTCVMCLLTSPCLPCLLLCGQRKLYRGKEREKRKKGGSWSGAAHHQGGGPASSSSSLTLDEVPDDLVPGWSRKDSDVSVGERDEVHIARLQSRAFQQLVHIQHPRARTPSGSSYSSSQGETRFSQGEPEFLQGKQRFSQGEQRLAPSSPAACLALGSGSGSGLNSCGASIVRNVYTKQTSTSSATGRDAVPLHHQLGGSGSKIIRSKIAGGISQCGCQVSEDNSGRRCACDSNQPSHLKDCSENAASCLEHERQGSQLENGLRPADWREKAANRLPTVGRLTFERQISQLSGISLPTDDRLPGDRLGQTSHIGGSLPTSRSVVPQQHPLQESLSNKLSGHSSPANGRHDDGSPHRGTSRVNSDSRVLKVHRGVTPSGKFNAPGSVFANGEEGDPCHVRSAVTRNLHTGGRSPAAAEKADNWDWDFSTISDKREFHAERIVDAAPGPLDPTPQDKETASSSGRSVSLRGRFRVTPSQDRSASMSESEVSSSDKDLSETHRSVP